MKRHFFPVLISALLLGVAMSASAAGSSGNKAHNKAHDTNVQKLMQARGCAGCHSAKSKLVGPAWDWVAYRFRNKPKKAAVDAVAAFIRTGGVGYWQIWTGGAPMPPHHKLTQQQSKAIARWVLAHSPKKPAPPGNK
jgi:cytochrome c